MLVLSRLVGETLVVAGDVYIKIDRIERGKVRLAIDAPDDVRVDRLEIHQARQQAEEVKS